MPVRRRTSGVAARSDKPQESVHLVVLAVPDAAAANRLQRSLEGTGFAVSALASTPAEAVAAVAAHRPSLCLFTSELAGEEFLPIQEIAQTSPGTCIVVLARRGDAEEMLGVLRAGAAGYVPATRTGKKLIESLELILAGYTPLPQEFLSEL
jgi:DNA-binding NarL/FixJ family response regulator